ncbi:MAG: PQQ-binding-like beta-propeller repeat protein [Halolamina sp.]
MAVGSSLTGSADVVSTGNVEDNPDWPTAGHDPARSSTNENSSGPKTTPNARWIYEFTDDDRSVPAVVSDGLVFVAGYQSLRAVDNETGEEVWNVTGVQPDAVSVADGVVISTEAGYSGEIRAYDATNGTERWNVTDFDADASVILNETLYVSSGEYLYTFDIQTGTEQWFVRSSADISLALSASGDTLYATGKANNRDYGVYALNASDGTERWRFEMEGPVSMHPVVHNGSVYVGAGSRPRDGLSADYDPKFYRLNDTDGHIEWVFDVNTRPHGAAVADGSVYLAAGNTIYALDDATGERQWLHRLSGSLEYGLSYTRIDALAPAVTDGVLYAVNDRGHLVGLNGTDGTELWSYRLEGEATRPAVADDRIYVHVRDTEDSNTDYSRVYALEEAPFQFSGLSLSKTTVAPGEEFTASVTVENVDDETRTYNLSLMGDPPMPVDWWALDRANGTLNPGESRQLTFTGQFNISGSWNVSVKRSLETDASVDSVTIDVVHPTRDDDWAQIDFDSGRTKYNPDTYGPKQHLQEVWNLSNFDDTVQPVISDGSVFVVQEPYVDGTQVEVVRGYDETTGAVEWEFNVSAQDRVLAGSPAVDNGTVYLYATPSSAFTSGNVYDASVFALNASDGSIRWKHDTRMNYSAISSDRAPVVDDGLVYVAGARVDENDDANASVLALDANSGTTAWRYDVNGWRTTEAFYSVSAENGTVVTALHEQDAAFGTTYTDSLVAIDASSGSLNWSTTGLTPDLSDPPVVRNGVVYVVNETTNAAGEGAETLFALDLADGSQQWEFVPPDQSTETDAWRIYDPTVTDDAVYVRQMMLDSYPHTNELYRLDPATGDIVWNRSTGSLTTRLVVDGLVYGGDGKYTYIFDAETGEYYSRTDLLSRERGSVQALANGTMITYADSTTPNDFRVLREGGIIEYTDLSVDRNVVTEDENLTVTATVTNVGANAREYDVNLDVAPDSGNSNHYIWNSPNREGVVQPGESTTITWVVELRERGDAVFALQPVNDGQDMVRHMYDRAGSATVNVGDAEDGQVVDLGGPRTLAPDTNSWPTESFDAGNTGNATGTGAPTDVGAGVVDWSVNHSDEWESGPIVANDTVFAGGDDGADAIFAYNATDGSLRWQYTTPDEVEVTPTYASGYLYTADDDGRVYQFDAATGERLWTFYTGRDINGITVVDDVAYIAGETSSEDRLYALNATTREILWTFGKSSTGYGMTTPAVENGTVYVTQDGQGTYAVNASTGVEEWSQPIAGSGSRLHSPVVNDGVVYVDDTTYSSTNANIYALTTANGNTIWSAPANVDGYTGSSPALANDTLYFTADGAVRAVNASTGDSRWSTTVCAAAEHSPVYADGVVYVPMSDSTIQAYDAETGDLVWRYGAYGDESFTPAIVGGQLYTTGLANSDYTYSLAALQGGTTNQSKVLFNYYGLSVSSANVTTGETVTVSATVANQGDAACEYTADLVVDGAVVDTTSGTVSGTDAVEFDYSFASTGTYNVTIGDQPPIEVNVTEAAADPVVDPATLDFGAVDVGTSADRYVQVRNEGTETLYITDTGIVGTDAADYSILSVSQTTVYAGDSATIWMRFAPSANGSTTATLEVDTISEGTVTATLTGTGETTSCVDADGDGYYVGCDDYTNRDGPDADDSDPNNWTGDGVANCTDADGDGYYSGCDAYTTRDGPDSDDSDPNNWNSSVTCTDADGDGYYTGCDAYVTINGPDADDSDPATQTGEDSDSTDDGSTDGWTTTRVSTATPTATPTATATPTSTATPPATSTATPDQTGTPVTTEPSTPSGTAGTPDRVATTDSTTTATEGPGFGITVTLLAAVIAALLVSRRRN